MRKDEVRVCGVVDLSDFAYSIDCEKKAKSVIIEIDKAQADVGFTEDLILHLIKEMKKEFKYCKDGLDEFKNKIANAIK